MKLFNNPPEVAKRVVAGIAPVPPIIRLEVAVPTSLLPLVNTTAPFIVNVFPAPIPTKPINPAPPPPKVMVPLTETEEESITDGVATEPVKLLERIKLFTVAGSKAPVVCATTPLKVKLVLLFAALVKLTVPETAIVPFTPLACAVVNVEPFVAPLPNKLKLPVPLITEVAGAVKIAEEVEAIPTLKVPGVLMVIVIPIFKVTPVDVLFVTNILPVITPVLPVPPAASNASPMACAVVELLKV